MFVELSYPSPGSLHCYHIARFPGPALVLDHHIWFLSALRWVVRCAPHPRWESLGVLNEDGKASQRPMDCPWQKINVNRCSHETGVKYKTQILEESNIGWTCLKNLEAAPGPVGYLPAPLFKHIPKSYGLVFQASPLTGDSHLQVKASSFHGLFIFSGPNFIVKYNYLEDCFTKQNRTWRECCHGDLPRCSKYFSVTIDSTDNCAGLWIFLGWGVTCTNPCLF